MLYFTLPNFCENFQLNLFMHSLTKTMPEAFKTKIVFCSQQGSFPYCSWNGGVNSNVGAGVYYNDLVDIQRSHALPFRINMSNVLLEDYDFYDNYSQTILEIFHDGSSFIEISSVPFMEKISQKYPYYRFMFSKNANLMTEFTPNLLNSMQDLDKFMLYGIPDKYTFDLVWLNQLQHKNKYEITVNPICPASCTNCDICTLKEHQNQLDYSNKSIFALCDKSFNVLNMQNVLTIETILKDYKGFNRFTFSNSYIHTSEEWIDFYIKYFIKPEFYLQVKDRWEIWMQEAHK